MLAGEYDAADVVGWADTASPATVQGQNLWVSVVVGRVFINAGTDSVAEVILTDILTTNGIIHAIDYVLLPLDIVDTAIAAGFDTLVAALAATESDTYCAAHVDLPCPAKLVTALRGDGPFTVFAPTDEAFDELLADLGITAGELLENPNLANILAYHVLAGEYDAADVVGWDGGTTPATLEGSTISVDVVDSTVVLNKETDYPADIQVVDIFATNGVIHAIDGVLIPPPDALMEIENVAAVGNCQDELLTYVGTLDFGHGQIYDMAFFAPLGPPPDLYSWVRFEDRWEIYQFNSIDKDPSDGVVECPTGQGFIRGEKDGGWGHFEKNKFIGWGPGGMWTGTFVDDDGNPAPFLPTTDPPFVNTDFVGPFWLFGGLNG